MTFIEDNSYIKYFKKLRFAKQLPVQIKVVSKISNRKYMKFLVSLIFWESK